MKKTLSFLLTGAMALFINGCGGGGSSLETAATISETDKVVISDANSEQVVSGVFEGTGAIDASDYVLLKQTGTAVTEDMLNQPTMKMVLDNVTRLNNISQDQSIACPYGGTISVTASSQTSGSASYNSCAVSPDIVFNGNITFSFSNLSQDMTSGYFTYTMKNFTVTQAGEVKMSFDSIKYEYELSNQQFVYFATTLNGKSSFTGEDIEFLNFKTTERPNENHGGVYTINGFINSPCIGGWVEVKTTQNIVQEDFFSCPDAGQITIDGNGSEVVITFNSDYSVTLSGAIEETLPNCDYLESGVCTR